MQQIYSNEKPKNHKSQKGPKKETIAFLLNYSKALRVKKYNGMTCEMLLN